MAELLGLGLSHFGGFMFSDAEMASRTRARLDAKRQKRRAKEAKRVQRKAEKAGRVIEVAEAERDLR